MLSANRGIEGRPAAIGYRLVREEFGKSAERQAQECERGTEARARE